MQLLNKLGDLPRRMQMLDVFRGYNHGLKIREGEWHEEQNMTAEDFPVLSTRRPRRVVRQLTAPAGLITKDAMAVIEGSNAVYDDYTVDLGLTSDGPKQLISMGAYLLIWPDKKYLNTQDLTDYGSMENTVAVDGTVSVTLCDRDGKSYGDYTISETAPANPSHGDMWMDTSNAEVPVLKEFSADSGMWVTIPTTYLKITGAGIDSGFQQYDGVTIEGLTGGMEGVNGSHVIYATGENYLVVVGIMRQRSLSQEGGLTVKRTVPDMDFVTECDNRVWGCKYGLVDGKPINEIYASKLGDFKNWNCFMGLSTDSFAAGRGSDGVFTGAITHLGHPLFFREDCIERVYPSSTGAHQIVTIAARGVQRGCWRSLAIVGETLFYKSRSDVCAFSGALPASVSEELGDEVYDDARAGAAGSVYYISMRRSDGTRHLFTYDTAKRIWHREDDTCAMMFTTTDGVLYWIDEKDNSLVCAAGMESENFPWQVTSGVIGYDLAENEYISRLLIRLDTTGIIQTEVRYDSGPWLDRGKAMGRGLGSVVIPVSPRRCDHLQIRISGKGQCKIYSIAKYIQRGSDVHW